MNYWMSVFYSANGVVGNAMEVLNTLGHGLLDKPYENALVVEFQQQGIPFAQQPRFPAIYKSVNVGGYISDLIISIKSSWAQKRLKRSATMRKLKSLTT